MVLNKIYKINKIIIQFIVQNENNIEKKIDKNNNIIKEPINLFKSISSKAIKKISSKVSQELYNKCEEIYFNSLKIYICCAQYAINLREMNLYEEYILEFVMKINLLLSKDNYIICNTFLLLTNLYMKMFNKKKILIKINKDQKKIRTCLKF